MRMNRWKNMRRGMAVILAAAMVGQSFPAYAGDFETEIETESVESEAENDFSDATEQENETDTVSVSPETESDDETVLDDETESNNQADTDEVVAVEEETEYFDDGENAEDEDINVFTDEEAGSADTGENGIIDYGTCSEGLTWTLDSEGVLRIDGKGAVTKDNIYSSKQGKNIGSWCNLEIKSIITGTKITEIDEFAFQHIDSLTSLDLPNVYIIAGYAFRNCSSLTSINMPEIYQIYWEAFANCISLESVYIQDHAWYLGRNAFSGCKSLKRVHLSINLTEIPKGTFMGCSSLSSISLGKNITTIGEYAFESTGIEEITIPEGVEEIRTGAFLECTKLKKIVFPSTLLKIYSEAFLQLRPDVVIFKETVPTMEFNTFGDTGDDSSIKFYYPARYSGWKMLSYMNEWGTAYAYDRVIPGEYHYNNDETCISNGTKTAECICGCGQTDTQEVEGTLNPDKHTYTDHYEILPDGSRNYYCDLCGKPQTKEQESGNCGDSLTWKIYNSNMLTISGTGIMYDYDDENPAPWGGKNIKYCKIESGATSIGYAAFKDCADLTSISMGDGIEKIGGYAFYGCTGLGEVQLPESVDSIDEVAFGECAALKKFTAYQGLKWIADNSFYKCKALTIYGYTGSSIYECAAKKGIAFESLGYWGICGDDMEWLLIGDELTISGESTVMLDYTSEDKAPWSELNVKRCIVKDGVKNIGNYAFAGCTGLTEIKLPDAIQGIGKNAFADCTGLTEIELPNAITGIEENAFAGCTGLTEIKLPNAITGIEESVFEGCTGLTEIEIPGSVTEINNRAFADCTLLRTVGCSENITEIGEEAFKGCAALEAFVVPDGVTEIKTGTFDGCALTEVQLPSALKIIGSRAFAGNKFTEVEIPASVTSIDQQAFTECEQLEKYVVDTESRSYSSSSGFLYNRVGTTLLSCPEGKAGVITISTKVKTIGDYAFRDCKKITELNLPPTLTTIGRYAFTNMTLYEIEIPPYVTSIGQYAFKDCMQLVAINADEESETFTSEKGILCNKEKTNVEICPPGLKEVTLWEGITGINAGTFTGMVEGTVIDLPFSLESISSENDFGAAPVFHIYDNAIIKWYLQSAGYKWESKGNYTVSWDNGGLYHKEMAYMQLRSILSAKPNGTYEAPGEGISYKLQLDRDGIDYQYTVTNPGKSKVTMSFQLGKYGVIDNKYTMNFYAYRLGDYEQGYRATLYKSQNLFKENQLLKFSWTISNKSIDADGANQLASITLYNALAYLSNGLFNCGGLQMKDVGYTSYVDVDTIHTVTSDGGKAPTCTEPGSTDRTYCSICGAVKNESGKIPAIGHTEEVIPAKEATCTEPGLTEGKKCAVCGEILEAQKEATQALGHNMAEVIDSPATCETDGSKHKECTRCGAKEAEETITATGHTEEVIPAKEATCTEPSLTEGKKCSTCGKILEPQEEADPALGHQMKSVTDKEATCGVDGSRHEECEVCGYKNAEEKIPATGEHKYGAYKVTRDATALTNGIKVRSCSVCGNQESASIAKLNPIIKLNTTSITLKVKQSTTKVTVSGLAKGDRVAFWKSSNTKIVTVSNTGKITAHKKTGSAVLTVTLKSGKKATVKVKVQKTDVKTKKISGLSKNITLKAKKKVTLKPVLSPITSVQKITYKTSNKAIATVSNKGVITAKKPGKVKITVQAGMKKFVVTVTVKK